MSNQQQGSNAALQEAPKTATPTEIKPGQQQNQGDGKPDAEKPAQQK
jgi:hypothetical protein